MWGAFLFDENLVVVVVVLGGCFGGEHRDLGDVGTTVYAKGLCSLGLRNERWRKRDVRF